MPFHDIASMDDPRLEPYRHLKFTGDMRRAGRFIAEGDKLVDRLLHSGLPIESVLMSSSFRESGALIIPADLPVLVADDPMLQLIVGFKFHRGVLACGQRIPSRNIEAVLKHRDRAASSGHTTIVVCVDIQDPTNLGTILRTSYAFGVCAVLLGGDCADPFSRRVLRVAMGAPFQLPIAHSPDLARDLAFLRNQHRMTLVATRPDPTAEPLDQFQPAGPLAILFGNESLGLAPHWIDTCDRQLTIPMHIATESLNVAVATGIVLYHLCREPRAANAARIDAVTSAAGRSVST